MGQHDLDKLEGRLAALEQRNQLLGRANPAISLGTSLHELGSVPMTMLRDATGAQSIVANAWRVVNMDTIVYDTVGGADLANELITIRQSGVYLVTFGMRFAGSNSTTARFGGFSVNSATAPTISYGGWSHAATGTAPAWRGGMSFPIELEVGDAIRLMAFTRTTENSESNEVFPTIGVLLVSDLL